MPDAGEYAGGHDTSDSPAAPPRPLTQHEDMSQESPQGRCHPPPRRRHRGRKEVAKGGEEDLTVRMISGLGRATLDPDCGRITPGKAHGQHHLRRLTRARGITFS